MEDGFNSSTNELPEHAKNGVVTPKMANFPEGIVAVSKEEKCDTASTKTLNGSATTSNEEEDISSESDALVIDESILKKKGKPKRSIKSKSGGLKSSNETEVIHHSNPYFHESLFELSQQHQQHSQTNNVSCKGHKLKKLKTKQNPKLREYAQYLGLQPAVQFKCSKCWKAGFESLTSLNEHMIQCTADPSAHPEVEDISSAAASFKLTRKVFLCSACGTYYENWNLYMHMLEFHKRYICLYCLGMFSILEDLCQHIQSKHNCEPGYKNSPEEFFNAYNEPCYVVCCECKKLFSEQDNFFYHNCVPPSDVNKTSQKQVVKTKVAKQQIRPEDHITGDSVGFPENSLVTMKGENQKVDHLKSEILPARIDANDQEIENIKTQCLDEDLELTIDKQSQNSNLTFEEKNPKFTDLPEKNEDDILNIEENSHLSEPVNSPESNFSNTEENLEIADTVESEDQSEVMETRKVPKLSLKLPKSGSFPFIEKNENDDQMEEHDKSEFDQIESENEEVSDNVEKSQNMFESQLQVAGSEINIVELELEHPLDKFDIKILLQKCLKATASICIYCNHARKIAVNGRELGLHAIAEHRYSAIVNSITAEELIPESFVSRIRESLDVLKDVFFNLESNLSDEAVTFSHLFECFQCRFSTSIHKELYLHNRKMHTKNLLLCIMCKSNFYSYSELLCHLCPGVYVLDYDVQFRCCMCVSDDLPSAFRLLVHLRKRHHVCDVCLEMCHNQYKLSNHVWKHKLHHFCYRCGIAYRNKLDITRHLFWKHGTESVLCKRCLQKKWPHVFHFCVPPSVFVCEECSLSFSKAVYLKVHRRLHSDDKPYGCTIEECEEKFISKKLLAKHELRHREPVEEKVVENIKSEEVENVDVDVTAVTEEKVEVEEEKPKPKVDVYDLPALNLSESDSSDSDDEKVEEPREEPKETVKEESVLEESLKNLNELVEKAEKIEEKTVEVETTNKSVPILDNIWDDFKMYQASKEKLDNLLVDGEKLEDDVIIPEVKEEVLTVEVALRDHDYYLKEKPEIVADVMNEVKPDLSQRVDHDYCTPKPEVVEPYFPPTRKPEEKSPKKRTISSSSSSSTSSSCSCGSNCSCSSTSGSDSSSSDSSNSDSSTEEGRRKQLARRGRRKQKKANKTSETVDIMPPAAEKTVCETPIVESDLETTESETDEEFYDKQPQILAKKLIEEKRNQILSEIGPFTNGGFVENSRTSTPSLPEEIKPKKKSKSKKRKKKKSERRTSPEKSYDVATPSGIPQYPRYQPPTVAPLTISLSRSSPIPTQSASTAPSFYKSQETLYKSQDTLTASRSDESNLRASKRRRIPNKFYGYSSDEEGEKSQQGVNSPVKWRKIEHAPSVGGVQQTQLVPPITIKTSSGSPMVRPTVEPITIRPAARSREMRVQQRPPVVPPLVISTPQPQPTISHEKDTTTDDSSADENRVQVPHPRPQVFHPPPPSQLNKQTNARNVQLYCYCRCPYDEVSEMIGCDSHDCTIEWFHFECVGIMVPPKGQWFCPDCRKRKQQRREYLPS